MEVVHEVCCGLDVHKKSVTACVLWASGRRRPRRCIMRSPMTSTNCSRILRWLNWNGRRSRYRSKSRWMCTMWCKPAIAAAPDNQKAYLGGMEKQLEAYQVVGGTGVARRSRILWRGTARAFLRGTRATKIGSERYGSQLTICCSV